MNRRTAQRLQQQPATELPPKTMQTIAGINNFGFRLLAQVAKVNRQQNLFISPLSIAIAFALVGHGATGTTRTQIHDTFGLTDLNPDEIAQAFAFLAALLDPQDTQVELLLANSLWQNAADPINPDYSAAIQRLSGADIFNINFSQSAAAAIINDWVADKTRGKIKQLVTPSDVAGAVVALLNAVYFKASWQARFDPQNTQELPFTLLDGSTKLQPLMQQTARFGYLENEFFQAVALPYGQGDYSMAVILPRPTVSFAELQQRFDQADWQAICSSFDSTQVNLSLPHFSLSYQQELNTPLQLMGISKAFRGDAEFPLIATGIFISKVIHQATLTVNEEGAEAAAATAIIMTRSIQPSRPVVMTVDRPFLCIIYDTHHKTILFAGYVVDPQ